MRGSSGLMGGNRAFWLFGVAVFAGDIATKLAVEASLELFELKVVFDGFFNLTHVRNPGGAFGLFRDMESMRIGFFIAVSAIALLAILYVQRKLEPGQKVASAALGSIFGGAAGNLVDRIRYGEVVDFLDFYLGQHHWPAFNVADVGITAGVALLFFTEFLSSKPTDGESRD